MVGWMARIAGPALCGLFVSLLGCPSANATEVIDVTGSIEHLAQVAMDVRRSADPPILIYRVVSNGLDETIRINVADSRYSSQVLYRDNCVATGYDKTVDCDLRMLDDLIREFGLLEIYGRESRAGTRQDFRKGLLVWILSHEFGHIVLGHDYGDYDAPLRGMRVFDLPGQAKELSADAFSIQLVNAGNWGGAFGTMLAVTNALLRRSVCPETFPKVCARMPRGVGLIYDYASGAKPIRIHLSGSHPDFIARFLRILYLEALSGPDYTGLAHEAAQAVDLLQIEVGEGRWETVRTAFGRLGLQLPATAAHGSLRHPQ